MGEHKTNYATLTGQMLNFYIKEKENKMMNNENGRSMVEMLGVLAIIGVLSVAGIAGYSMAMKKYRTNEILNAASMLYILATSQNAGNGPTDPVSYIDVGGSAVSGASSLQYNPAPCAHAGCNSAAGCSGDRSRRRSRR